LQLYCVRKSNPAGDYRNRGCYFTIGVEVLYSDYIKEIAKAVPDHLLLLLTEPDNPGALSWLKKNNEVGMPMAIKKVVEAVAALRQSTPHQIESLVQANFASLIVDDPWLREIGTRISQFQLNFKT
jgi:TatD DNase family protein